MAVDGRVIDPYPNCEQAFNEPYRAVPPVRWQAALPMDCPDCGCDMNGTLANACQRKDCPLQQKE